MDAAFDGIILGTGHNALVLQAYLSRCGVKTASVDRAATPGGGLMTLEDPAWPGFRHNPHSFFHRGLTAMPWFADLELARHGVRYIEPELNVAMLLDDGRALEWWTDLERTAESVAAFSRRDARAVRRWAGEFKPIVDEIIRPEAQSPPLAPARRRRWLEATRAGRRLLEVSALSPLAFVIREFENDAVRAGMLFFNGLREVDLSLRGFGHTIPALLASSPKAQMCVGGSAALAQGLVRDIERHGGVIRCGIAPRAILVCRGRAIGVALSNGEQIEARAFIASGLNPQQTFLELIAPGSMPSDLRAKARGFRYNRIAPLFGLHVALEEPPRYAAAATRPELEQAFMTILGLEGLESFRALKRAHGHGQLPPMVAWGACPTRFDRSQAPPGKHTAFLWEKVPYALRGNAANWEREKERHRRELIAFWSRHAPNLEQAILHAFALTPLDTVCALPNMRLGDLLVGSFGFGQRGYHRPFGGAGCYRTPVPGLYLCGGSTHPGGNITGLCGYNAAAVVASDLGLRRWWSPRILGEEH